jgi:hypothetical protein
MSNIGQAGFNILYQGRLETSKRGGIHMKETEKERQQRLIRNSKEESDMEWILACLMIILLAGFFTI